MGWFKLNITSWFKKKKQISNLFLCQYRVVESIRGNFFYHLAVDEDNTICGSKEFMERNLPIETWGMKTHLGERYCHQCDMIRIHSAYCFGGKILGISSK